MSYPPQGYPPPGWNQYGAPPPQYGGPPPGGSRRWVWILLASAAVLTVVAVVVAAVVGVGDDTSVTTAATTTGAPGTDYQEPSTTATPTTTPTTTTPTTTAPAPTSSPGPTTGESFCGEFSTGPGPATPAGWRTAVGPRGLAYDVPPDWEVMDCGSLVGWEKPCADGPFGFCPVRMMSGASTLETPQCLRNPVAMAGLPGAKNTTDINEAVKFESDLVKDIYTSSDGHVPAVSFSAPKNLTVGGAPAVQVVATVTDIEAQECVGPTALHSMVATKVPGQEGTVLFVISLAQGIAGVPAPAIIDQMVATLRPVG